MLQRQTKLPDHARTGNALAARFRLSSLILASTLVFVLSVPASAGSRHATFALDAKTGETLAASAADESRYPASLTKMMTLYIVFELIEQKRLSYATTLKMTERAANQPPSSLGVEPGSAISIREAVLALITKSANDVATAIAENLAGTEEKFAEVMTRKARELGMSRTVFRNASGLPDPGQTTTARDMATLAMRLAHDFPDHYRLFSTREFSYGGRTYRNHNTMLRSYEGTDGVKTGYTRASGFNLVASVRRGKKHVIGVVMGGRSARLRNATMANVMDRALQSAKSIDRPVLKSRPMLVAQPRVHQTRGVGLADLTASTRPAATSAPARATPVPAQAVRRRAAVESAPKGGTHTVQVGAYGSEQEAQRRLADVARQTSALLSGYTPTTQRFQKDKTQYYRARFSGFDAAQAQQTCERLKKQRIDCFVASEE